MDLKPEIERSGWGRGPNGRAPGPCRRTAAPHPGPQERRRSSGEASPWIPIAFGAVRGAAPVSGGWADGPQSEGPGARVPSVRCSWPKESRSQPVSGRRQGRGTGLRGLAGEPRSSMMGLRTRGRMGSGGPTGLQNQLARLNPGPVGSIPTRSRQVRRRCRHQGSVPATPEAPREPAGVALLLSAGSGWDVARAR